MPEPFPNHLISIPNSVLSFKHYFLVHDQRFSRTAIYLGILAVLITGVSMGMGLLGYAREAPKLEARQAKELAAKLAGLKFKDGKATAEGEQPTIVYQDYETFGRDEREADAKGEPPQPKPRVLLVVLDTTGKVATPEAAAAFAGCAQSKQVILFGRRGVTQVDLSQKQQRKPEPAPYTKERLEELRKLIEEKGGKPPEVTLDEVGNASFSIVTPKARALAHMPVPRAVLSAMQMAQARRVHLLLHTPELMVLVDATGKDLSLKQAHWTVVREHPEMQPPEFLVVLTAREAVLKAAYEAAPRTLDYAALASPDGASVARWVAATARQARHDIIAKGLAPNAMKMLFYVAFEVLIIALICSVAGLIVNGLLRGGIAYGQILTMAVYAMTPGRLLLPILVALAGIRGDWVAALPFVVGMGYTATATYRTARELSGTGHAPPL